MSTLNAILLALEIEMQGKNIKGIVSLTISDGDVVFLIPSLVLCVRLLGFSLMLFLVFF